MRCNMDKKLKLNVFLKGVSVFAFVAFCLLAILAGVTLPFVSGVNTVDNVAFCSESDFAVASADFDTFNPLDFCIPLSQCNTSNTYYGLYITEEFYNYCSQNSTEVNTQYGKFSNGYFLMSDNNGIFLSYNGLQDLYIAKYNIPYSANLNSIVFNTPVTFKSITTYSGLLMIFNKFPYGIEPVSNFGFESRFGNFVGIASSDFYINLDVAPVIPNQLCQVLVPGSISELTGGWSLKAQSSIQNLYYLSLFDRYYLNGSLWSGYLNCGWMLDYRYSSAVPQLYFSVLGTNIWKADCDFSIETGLISNVRNGQFLVSSNYISNFNVYKISSADESLYIMRDVYNDVAYSSFLDSFIAQYDFKNVKIPSDNALYLKGYQSASDEYYNNGYNTGFSEGQKSGYNTGFSAGDSAGYSRGLEDSNNYSFLSLFGAVFDAPIQALFGGTQRLPAGTKITDSNGNTITLQTATTVNRGGLLNFELMGVNLSGFVLALFSLSILIVVIKFALGKGR